MDPSSRPMEGPWKGESKIVVGIDIGTTDSGVSFACLQQGKQTRLFRGPDTYVLGKDTTRQSIVSHNGLDKELNSNSAEFQHWSGTTEKRR